MSTLKLIHLGSFHLDSAEYIKTKKCKDFYLDASKAGHKGNQRWAKGRKQLARVLPAPDVLGGDIQSMTMTYDTIL